MQKHARPTRALSETVSDEQRMLAAQTQEAGAATVRQRERRIGRAQGLTVAQYMITLAQVQQWIEVKQDQPWLAEGLRWEEWAPINLGYSDTHIDQAIKNVHKLGPQNYEMLQQIGATQRQIAAIRRGVEAGDVEIEGTTISIGRLRFDLARDREQVKAYLVEMRAVTKSKDEQIEKAEAALTGHQELARKSAEALIAARDALKAEVERFKQLPPPVDLASDTDRESWRAARQALAECDVRVASLAALAADPQRTDVLRARVMGHLRTLKGWIQAAEDEIAEQMPPEWADIIETEQADCALAPALPREIVEEVRERVRAKGGLTLVADTGASNGHGSTPLPLPA